MPICIFQIKLLQDFMEIGQQQLEMERKRGAGGKTEKPEQSADEFHLQSKIKCEKKQRKFSLFEVKLLFQNCVARGGGRREWTWRIGVFYKRCPGQKNIMRYNINIELIFSIDQEYILFRYIDKNIRLLFYKLETSFSTFMFCFPNYTGLIFS